MIKKFNFNSENVLAYNDFGNSNGFPILVQHGTMASIKDTGYFDNLGKIARIICIARPGYGESSPYVLQNLLEYGTITAKLVKELGIDKFDILASSAGALYGYAIAKAYSDRTRNVYVYSGTPALYDSEVQKNWPFPNIMAERTATLLCDCEFELLGNGSHFSGDGYKSFLQNTVMKALRK